MNKSLPLLVATLAISIQVIAQQNSGSQSDGPIQRNKIDNTVTSVTFQPSENYTQANISDFFAKNFGKGERFVLQQTTRTKQGTTIERYQEYYGNERIEGGVYAVMYNKSGTAAFVNGNGYNADAISTSSSPKLSEEEARQAAIASVHAERYAWEEEGLEKLLKQQKKDDNATYYPKGELVWVEEQSATGQVRKLRLAYKLSVYALKPLSNEDIYIDAANGEVLYRNSLIHHTDGSAASLYSGTINFKIANISSTKYLYDSTRGGGIGTYNLAGSTGGTAYLVSSSTSTFATDVAVDAHWGAEKVYDYWLNEQGRNSFNNAGGTINNFVHYGTGYDNAFWDGYEMIYGDGSGLPSGFLPLAALDVCAHEIGHGVCQYTASLAYNRESGAMNEGFSDIWGAVIENYANPHESDSKAKNMWEIGEEIAATPLRRMNTPNTRFQPDTYGGTYWVNVTTTACPTPSNGNDYCGVHTNSGVLNHWFYVMCQGESGTNDIGNSYAVTGIGVTEGADIAYQTELLLTSASTYASARTASISAATTLYGACSAEVEAVTRAWYAVGVGANYTGGSATAITGTATVCISATTTLSNATTGGTWTSSNTGVATIGSSSGTVTGVAAGTAGITYTTSSGCTANTVVTVSAVPTVNVITGAGSVCQSSTITLANATTGGSWTSSNTSVATIGSSSGIVSGSAAGTTTISYSKSNGCGSAVATMNVTVYASPATIGGTATVCVSGTTTLTNTVSGGTWYSSNTGVADVGSASGVVSGIGGGNATITYMMPGSCLATKSVTVSILPTVNVITGPSSVCKSSTITLGNATVGGTWSSTSTSVATIGSTGVLTGANAGAAIISYTITNGCGSVAATANVTVYASPAGISGSSAVCIGNNITLSNSVSGGTWSSSSTGVASVGSGTGIVTGAGIGTATISYIMPGACYTTKVVSANVTPTVSAISGSSPLCQGSAATYTDATAGGVWASSNPSVATIGSITGSVNPLSAGTANISYTITNTCASVTATANLTVLGTPAAIGGVASVCAGATTTLTNSVSGGTWSSSNEAVATVNASGVVSGLTNGNSYITYTIGGICYATKQVTVGAITISTSGDAGICAGTPTTLTVSGATDYTWSPGTDLSATTGSSVTASPTGTTVYTVIGTVGSCSGTATITVSVSGTPSASAGADVVCTGGSVTFTNVTSGGTWSSSNPSVATVGTSGLVTGVGSGTVGITYSLSVACYTVKTVSVGAMASITGTTNVCLGTTTALSHPIAGGTWSSASPYYATIDAATGVATGVHVGHSVITYTANTSCVKTTTVNVPNIVLNLVGTLTACEGSTSAIACPGSPGGTWTTDNPAIATINASSGMMTGVSAGTTNITYSYAYCFTSRVATVSPMPAAITGASPICVGNTLTLASTTSGGTWTSSNTSVATVGSSSGMVTGAGAGTATITYALGSGCRRTTVLTVGVMPAAITGSMLLCTGGTTTLSCTTTGGTWVSGSAGVATVGSATGVVAGVGAGVASISYVHSGGCMQTAEVTVNSAPGIISGTLEVCPGGTSTLTNATSGGTWSSGSTAVATIDSSSGMITGVSNGTTTITYAVAGSACYATAVATVNNTLAAISGPATVCAGASITLTHSTSGGTWSSSNTAKVIIDAATGVATGVATGSAVITYTVASGCYATYVLTVPNISLALSGSLELCEGNTTTLSCTSTGGAWSSGNTSVATINASTGVMSGIAAGTSDITYSLAGCSAYRVASVNANPSAIAGASTTCVGNTISLSNTTTGGTWASSNTAVATVGSLSGLVATLTPGTSAISYVLPSGCLSSTVITVGVMPAAITGTTTICQGSTTTLSSTTGGGTWSSSDGGTAAVSSSSDGTAIILGAGAGVATISYNHSGGCVRTVDVTVNAATPANTGVPSTCVGGSTPLSNTASGGTWSSSNTTKATVGSGTGLVTGIAAGTADITYRTSSTCYSITQVTVNSSAGSISGASSVCVGQATTLTHAVSGGTWSSNNTARATVDGSGVVNGVSAGSVIITYVPSPGCVAIKSMNVYNSPAAISGPATVCEGSIAALTSTAGAAGTWSSSNPALATVNSSGTVTGIDAGTPTITFRATATGCSVTRDITVNETPVAITGPVSFCSGASATYSNVTGGGVWSRYPTTTAALDSFSGTATGTTSGPVTIKYTLSSGCLASKVVTVLALPGAISGATVICVDNTVTLTVASSGGTWSSSDASIAGITGITATTVAVSGVGVGTAGVSYTGSNGCSRVASITVNPALPETAGPTTVCVGNYAYLTNSASGGTWASSSTAKATVGMSTGLVSGIATGTANITYTVGVGCKRITPLTINAAVATVTGTTSVCVGQSATFTSTTTGGAWTSADESIATVAGGAVTGVGAGTTYITYALGEGCYKTKSIIVKAAPVITGGTDLVVGGALSLEGSPSGGAWASSTTSVATVSVYGYVTGVAAGSATITYSAGGCYTTSLVTVTSVEARGASGMEKTTADGFAVFPNPTYGTLQVQTGTSGIFIVYNVDGKEVMKQAVEEGNSALELPAGLAPGIYMARFSGRNGVSAQVRLVYKP